MTDYTKTTDFAAKDTLPSGDPSKVIKGAEFEVEFDNIATAIASKFDSTSTFDINAGNIDGTVIGAASPAAATFTTLAINNSVSGAAVLDEDDMASDSDTKLATQQSIKAYVDSNAGITGISSTATSTQIDISDARTKFTNDIELHHPNGNKIEFFTAASSTQPKGEIQMYSDTELFIRAGQVNAAQILLNSANGGSTTFQSEVTCDEDLNVGENITISSRGSQTLNNIGIGRNALDATAGSLNKAGNIAIGTNSQTNNTDGMKNISVGDGTLSSLTDGNSNTAVGYNAGDTVSTGDYNTAIGEEALRNGQTGSYNTAIGSRALWDLTTQSRNTAVGYEALGTGALTGNATAVGYQALYNNNTSSENIGIGYQAGYLIQNGAFNVVIGREALSSTQLANWNVAIGTYALQSATSTSTDRNIAIGYSTNGQQTSPKFNVSVGDRALYSATGVSAWNNTSVGHTAHYDLTTGANNTALGSAAGDTLTTGSNNTSLGYQSAPSAAGSSNQVTLGNSSISSLRCQVTSISGLSDARDKTNVEPLSGASDFIRALNPVSFEWNQRDGNRIGEKDHGFIAQDLQAVQSEMGYEVPRLVLDENPEKLEAAYGTLLPTIVAALQEALAEIETLKAQLGNA